jgi:hypothetical protein
MKKNLYVFIALILLCISEVKADVITSCYDCNATDVKNSALNSTPRNDIVHVVNFKAGVVKSFKVEHEFEPGFEIHMARPTTTPYEIEDATREISYVVKSVIQNGGKFNKYTNILTDTVDIPGSIAGTSSDVKDYLNSQAVSNYLRLKLVADFWDKFDKAWEKVIEKITFKVEAKFADGSTAIYSLGPIFFSDHPFILEHNSIKDSNGNLISNSTTSAGGNVSYGSTISSGGGGGGGFGGISRQCRGYTITSSSGSSWSGSACWYTWMP